MQYYIMYQGQVTGPMTKEQIFAYGVNRDTMVSAEGGAWRPLYTDRKSTRLNSSHP